MAHAQKLKTTKEETTKEKIIKALLKDPTQNRILLAEKLGTTRGNVQMIVGELIRQGKIERMSSSKTFARDLKKEEANLDPKVRIKKILKEDSFASIDALTERLGISISKVKSLINEMINQGHNYKLDGNEIKSQNFIEKPEPISLNVKKMSNGFYRFGVIGDNHLGSKYERLDVLNALYQLFEDEGITKVFNTGNWIEGEAKFNTSDVRIHGLDNQVDYFLEKYPNRKGISTHFVTGDDHEGWYNQKNTFNIGRYVSTRAKEEGRPDLVHLGYMEADIDLKAPDGLTKLRVLHPGGGSSYAVSYTAQKIIESYQPGEKPDILLIGHFHKAEYLLNRGVHAVQTACTQDQSTFMRKKRLAAHLGGWIIEFSTDVNGAIVRFKPELIPFYDNKYYKKWAYKWK